MPAFTVSGRPGQASMIARRSGSLRPDCASGVPHNVPLWVSPSVFLGDSCESSLPLGGTWCRRKASRLAAWRRNQPDSVGLFSFLASHCNLVRQSATALSAGRSKSLSRTRRESSTTSGTVSISTVRGRPAPQPRLNRWPRCEDSVLRGDSPPVSLRVAPRR